MSVPVDLDERLRAIERRIRDLAVHVEPLFDIRLVAEGADRGELDAMLARVQTLSVEVSQRETAGEWDALDQLTARMMLLTLAHIAVELRRRLNEGSLLLTAGRKRIEDVRHSLAAFERELAAEKEKEEPQE